VGRSGHAILPQKLLSRPPAGLDLYDTAERPEPLRTALAL
jgi:hypothetical protein